MNREKLEDAISETIERYDHTINGQLAFNIAETVETLINGEFVKGELLDASCVVCGEPSGHVLSAETDKHYCMDHSGAVKQ